MSSRVTYFLYPFPLRRSSSLSDLASDLCERVRMDYWHTDPRYVRWMINRGFVDQEEAHLAIIEGRRRWKVQDCTSSWKDLDGYNGYLHEDGFQSDDEDDEGRGLLV